MIIKLRSNSLVGWLYNITNRFVPCIHKYIYIYIQKLGFTGVWICFLYTNQY